MHILNQRTVADDILRDIFANRPAAGVPGRKFQDTDSGQIVYRDNGTTWEIENVPRPLMMGRPRGPIATIYFNLPGVLMTGTGTFAPLDGDIYYFPIFTTSEFRMDRIRYEVTTAGGIGTTFRWGIYRATQDWQPDNLIHDNTTQHDMATVGVSASIIPTTNPVILNPGRYLISFVTDAVGAIMRSINGGISGAGVNFNFGATPFVSDWRIIGAVAPSTAFASQGTDWSSVTTGATLPNYPIICRQSIADATNP